LWYNYIVKEVFFRGENDLEQKLFIEGQVRLTGEVVIGGAKNAAVAALPALILSDSKFTVRNLPCIDDVHNLVRLLELMGAEIKMDDEGVLTGEATGNINTDVDYEIAKKMRASYYFIGALLGKYGEASVPFPGGCDFGIRPIDLHIKGFEALGATIKVEHGIIKAKAEKLVGATIYLDVVSVGATINIMLAAVKAEGITVIENAAKEPHVVDVANLLNAMGAMVKGAGTDVIRITGVDYLGECDHSIIPDMLEAGTYMIATAACSGDVLVSNVIPFHLESLSAKLREMGVEVDEYEESIRVRSTKRLKSINLKTLPYPGFPSDLQQPMCVLLSISEGTGVITEGVWEGRFKHLDELKKMGAHVRAEGRVAIIDGVEMLSGAQVFATDLRGGAAMIIAALVAEGETEIGNIFHIERGYEKLEYKLSKLGAKVKRRNKVKK